jgi:uncharacterized protein
MVKQNVMKTLLSFLLFGIALGCYAQRAVPPLWGHRVHDEAKILAQQTVDELELMLQRHQDSTSNQIAVLIIPSLDGDNLEEYSLRVAEEWKLGTATNDNGVLLLVVVNDRKVRIEVGSGLEGVLPDAITSRIIRNEIAPSFREHQYDRGIRAGLNAIIRAAANEYEADLSGLGNTELTTGEKVGIGLFLVVVLGVFTMLALFIPGCGGWGIYGFLMPFYATFPSILIGTPAALKLFGVYALGFPILKAFISRTDWGKRMAKSFTNKGTGGGSSGGGWGAFSGGSSSGGGFSGGGFSGGGGSFGGGGSSGSW